MNHAEDFHVALDCLVAAATLAWIVIGMRMGNMVDKVRLEMGVLRLELKQEMSTLRLETNKVQLETAGVLEAHIGNDEIHFTEVKRRLDNIERVFSHRTAG